MKPYGSGFTANVHNADNEAPFNELPARRVGAICIQSAQNLSHNF